MPKTSNTDYASLLTTFLHWSGGYGPGNTALAPASAAAVALFVGRSDVHLAPRGKVPLPMAIAAREVYHLPSAAWDRRLAKASPKLSINRFPLAAFPGWRFPHGHHPLPRQRRPVIHFPAMRPVPRQTGQRVYGILNVNPSPAVAHATAQRAITFPGWKPRLRFFPSAVPASQSHFQPQR